MEKGELDNILRVWMRRDAGMLVIAVALIYSIIKFFRRVVIRLISNRFQ
jgi:hypothetical protein